MSLLAQQQCSHIENLTALDAAEINQLLQQLSPAWTLDATTQTISRQLDFKNYYQTMAFVNVIAQIAHQQNHHPDISVSYNHCTVHYSTHSVNGLSIKDFICAAKVNAAQTL